MRPAPLLFPVVNDIDLLARRSKFQTLPNFDFLLLRIVLQPLNAHLFLFNLAPQFFIAGLEPMHLLPFLNQALQTVWTAQSHKRIHDSAENDDGVRSFSGRDLHRVGSETIVTPNGEGVPQNGSI